MLSIHRIATLRAKSSSLETRDWIEITFSSDHGEKVDLVLFLDQEAFGPTFAAELAQAINNVVPRPTATKELQS